MRQVTKMQKRYFTLGDKVRYYYWKTEDLIHEIGLWVMPPFILISIFFFFAQVDYAKNKDKRDFSVLPIEKQQRFTALITEELELDRQESRLRRDLMFSDARALHKKRVELTKEIHAISAAAPHSSWGYNLYLSLGFIKG